MNTSITNIDEFLDHIVASTNMRCLTPPIALDGDCGFLAANLYAKSAFGEDALVNVSIEKARNGKLAGNIRIRYCCAGNSSHIVLAAAHRLNLFGSCHVSFDSETFFMLADRRPKALRCHWETSLY